MNTQIPLDTVLSFQNDTGTIVTNRIADGKTQAYQLNEFKEAAAHARKTRSYVYNLFANTTINGRAKTIQYGYAVPK